MDSQSVRDYLQQFVEADTLALPVDAVSSPSWQQLAPLFFDDGQLTIGQMTMTVGEDESVSVNGRLPLLTATNLTTTATFTPAANDQLKITLALQTAASTLDLLAIVQACLPQTTNLPTLALNSLTMTADPAHNSYAIAATMAESWPLAVGKSGFAVSDLQLALQHDVASSTTSAALAGTAHIGATAVTLTADIADSLVFTAAINQLNLATIIDNLCDDDVMGGISLPSGFLDMDFTDIAFMLNPTDRIFSFTCQSDMGLTEMIIGEAETGWEFAAGFSPPSNWKLSKIDNALSVLDDLDMSGITMLFTSVPDDSLVLPTLTIPEGTVVAGLNFYADLDLAALGVKALLGVEALVVQTAVSNNPSDLLLAARIEGEFDLGGSTTFGDITFRLRPNPADFSVVLLGTVSTKINGDPLAFIGSMAVEVRSATFAATMLGTWNDPFGFKRVAISDVALELGVSFPPPLPSIGVAGALTVGNFEGAMAVKFDSATPSQSMLAIAFNRLYLEDIVKTFCVNKVYKTIPSSWWDSFLNVGLTDVDLYIAPQDTQIGELYYESGFRVQGNLTLWGWDGYGRLLIDESDGITADAELEPINLANALILSGAEGQNSDAEFHLRISQNPSDLALYISSSLILLGLEKTVLIDVSDSGMTFLLEEDYSANLSTMLSCTLKNGRFDASGSIDFNVNATVGPIKIEGVKVADKIRLVNVKMEADAVLKVTTAPSFFLKLSGDFNFYGQKLDIPTLKINATPDDFDAVAAALVTAVEDAADDIFAPLFSSATKWATAVGQDFIEFTGDAAQVLHDGFNQTAEQTAAIMKSMGKGVNTIADGLKATYGYTAEGAATLLKGAGYTADQVGGALKSAYNTSAANAAKFLKKAGYTSQQVGTVLKNAYSQSAESAAKLLKGAGYAADEVGSTLKNAFNTSAETATKYLKTAGYSINQVNSALKNAYRVSSTNATKYLKAAGYGANDIAKSLESVYSLSSKEISKAMKAAGYALDDVGDALKAVGKFSENSINDALKGAGYAGKSIKKFMSKTFGGKWKDFWKKLF